MILWGYISFSFERFGLKSIAIESLGLSVRLSLLPEFSNPIDLHYFQLCWSSHILYESYFRNGSSAFLKCTAFQQCEGTQQSLLVVIMVPNTALVPAVWLIYWFSLSRIIVTFDNCWQKQLHAFWVAGPGILMFLDGSQNSFPPVVN